MVHTPRPSSDVASLNLRLSADSRAQQTGLATQEADLRAPAARRGASLLRHSGTTTPTSAAFQRDGQAPASCEPNTYPVGVARRALIQPGDVELYAAQMQQVKARLDAAQTFLAQPFTYPSVESAALQVRSAIETVALSSLVANRHQLETASSVIARKDYSSAVKLMRRMNPNFWPKPSRQRLDAAGRPVEMVPIETGFLTEGEHAKAWGKLSSWLHARNPYNPVPDPSVGASLVTGTIDLLIVLLNHHTIELIDRDQMLACLMNASDSGKVQVSIFERI